jgi:hypothetical protein
MRPMNVAENTAPLLLLPAPQEESSCIRNCIPGATSMDMEPIHGTGTVGLQEMPRHVPGSGILQIVTHKSLPGILLT